MKTLLILILVVACVSCAQRHEFVYDQRPLRCLDGLNKAGEHVGACFVVAELAK